MNITCPKCCTTYVIDDIKSNVVGRSLRCSTCGNKWQWNPLLNKQPLVKKTFGNFSILAINEQFRTQLDYYYNTQPRRYSTVNPDIRRHSYSGTGVKANVPAQAYNPLSQSVAKSKTSISQCVFCKRSSKCNMHDLYSGRLH